MIKFTLTDKKIKIETENKSLKKEIKRKIKEFLTYGFKKNSAKAIILSKLCIKFECNNEANIFEFNATKEDILDIKLLEKSNI